MASSKLPALPAGPQIQLAPETSFIGGLNFRADAFQLGPTESPDLLNVDLDPRGGFYQRNAVSPLNSTALSSTPTAMWEYSASAGLVAQVMVQQGSDFAYSTGSNFTSVNPDALTTSGKMRAAVHSDLCYIQRNAENAAIKWDGSTATVLGTSFNDDLTSPSGTNMPKAKCIAAWGGYMWVANTNESGTAHHSRVRFSHPNKPADFRTNDYIDIDIGHDGDEITALVPFSNRLLVFKTNSVHAIFGSGVADFQAVDITFAAGAISQDAVVATEFGVYFFDWPSGLMRYDGRSVSWVFERIQPKIEDGSIVGASLADITVGWINRRVWVAVPYEQSTNNRVFVLDPKLAWHKRYGLHLGEDGAWTQYDIPCGAFLAWHPPGEDTTWLAASPTTDYVLKLEQDAPQDDYGAGSVDISSYYVTRWYDVGSPAQWKRWKRPEIAVRGGNTMTLRFDVYHDFDPSQIKRTMTAETTATSSNSLVWDDGSHAANMKWDANVWGGDSPDSEELIKLSNLGRSKAVRFKITGPSNPSVKWQVDAITLKYIPLRIRN